jgi:hypothetical protein
MGVLERKKDGTEVISVRVPTAINAKLLELRRRARLLGFNFNATLAGILSAGAKQIHEELAREEQKIGAVARTKSSSDAKRRGRAGRIASGSGGRGRTAGRRRSSKAKLN